MDYQQFNYQIKKILSQLMIEKKMAFLSEKKGSYIFAQSISYGKNKYKLVPVSKFGSTYKGLETDILNKQKFSPIEIHKPNWSISSSPMMVFGYIVDNLPLQYMDELFHLYSHITNYKNCFSVLIKKTDKSLAKQFFIKAIDKTHGDHYRMPEDELFILENAKKIYSHDDFYIALQDYLTLHHQQYNPPIEPLSIQFVLKEFIEANFSPEEQKTFTKFYPLINKTNSQHNEDIFYQSNHKHEFIFINKKNFYSKIKINENIKTTELSHVYNKIMNSIIEHINTQMKHLNVYGCCEIHASLPNQNNADMIKLLITHNNEQPEFIKDLKKFIFCASLSMGENAPNWYPDDHRNYLENFRKIDLNKKLQDSLEKQEEKNISKIKI